LAGAVKDAQDLDLAALQPVGDDVGGAADDQLAGIGASAGATDARVIDEAAHIGFDLVEEAQGSARIPGNDIVDNRQQISAVQRMITAGVSGSSP
jgi:hypothetical protein